MLLPTRPVAPRRGLSLLEVLVALAIFLLSFVALGKLVTMSSDQAVEVQYQSQATHMAKSKLNEVVSGALPLSSQSGTIDEDPDWQWSIETEQGEVASLWTVHVKVWRMFDDHEIASNLSQMVLDPSVRGSMFDQVVVTGSQDTAPQSSSTSGSMSGSSGTSGQQGMSGGATASGGAGASGAMAGGAAGKGGGSGAAGAAGKGGGSGAAGGAGGAAGKGGGSGAAGGAGGAGGKGGGSGTGGGAGGGAAGGAGGVGGKGGGSGTGGGAAGSKGG